MSGPLLDFASEPVTASDGRGSGAFVARGFTWFFAGAAATGAGAAGLSGTSTAGAIDDGSTRLALDRGADATALSGT